MQQANCLLFQKGKFVHPAWYKQQLFCSISPHSSLSAQRPSSKPTNNPSHFSSRTILELQEHEELQYSRITTEVFGQPSPLTLVQPMVLREQQEGFAKTAQLLRQNWHVPTNRQSWKQCGWLTIILSVPFKHCSERSWLRGC